MTAVTDVAPAPETLRLTLSWQGELAVLTCRGPLDASAAGLVDNTVDVALSQRPTGLLFDLGGVESLDTAGLRAVLSAVHRGKQQGCTAALCSLQPDVAETLHRLYVDRTVPCYHDMAEAATEMLLTRSWR